MTIAKSGEGDNCYTIICPDEVDDKTVAPSALEDSPFLRNLLLSMQERCSPISSDCESQGRSSARKQSICPIQNDELQLIVIDNEGDTG